MVLLLGGGAKAWANTHQVFVKPSNQPGKSVAMASLIQYLNDHNINHVYSLDPLLQWQIIFYSKEKVLARWKNAEDRYPLYPKTVDLALKSGENTAIIGFQPEASSSEYSHKFTVVDNTTYLIYQNPEKQMLIQLGFELNF
jgi:Tfp pilus assembly ATPase PilU